MVVLRIVTEKLSSRDTVALAYTAETRTTLQPLPLAEQKPAAEGAEPALSVTLNVTWPLWAVTGTDAKAGPVVVVFGPG